MRLAPRWKLQVRSLWPRMRSTGYSASPRFLLAFRSLALFRRFVPDEVSEALPSSLAIRWRPLGLSPKAPGTNRCSNFRNRS